MVSFLPFYIQVFLYYLPYILEIDVKLIKLIFGSDHQKLATLLEVANTSRIDQQLGTLWRVANTSFKLAAVMNTGSDDNCLSRRCVK